MTTQVDLQFGSARNDEILKLCFLALHKQEAE